MFGQDAAGGQTDRNMTRCWYDPPYHLGDVDDDDDDHVDADHGHGHEDDRDFPRKDFETLPQKLRKRFNTVF